MTSDATMRELFYDRSAGYTRGLMRDRRMLESVIPYFEMEDGKLDTQKVKAFRVPAGVMIECYATTLHYAPCQGSKEQGFQVLIALPLNTNTPFPAGVGKNPLDRQLWARNKWLIAHPEAEAAKKGAAVGLQGENIDIKELI